MYYTVLRKLLWSALLLDCAPVTRCSQESEPSEMTREDAPMPYPEDSYVMLTTVTPDDAPINLQIA